MAQSAIILPDGWQVAIRRAPPGADPRAVYWLQRRIQHGHKGDAGEEWEDVRGPYRRRSNAVDVWRAIEADKALER